MDAFAELRIVDYGDAPVLPADPARSAAAIETDGRRSARRGPDPDRARRRPLDRRAGHRGLRGATRPGRARPLRHAHGHRHRGLRRRGVARDADVPARRAAVRSTRRATSRSAFAATGPGSASSPGRPSRGSRRSSCTRCGTTGIDAVVERAVELVGAGPVFLSVDVDVLDPAFAPGTGTPEPGGMTSVDLLQGGRASSPSGSSSSAPTSSR